MPSGARGAPARRRGGGVVARSDAPVERRGVGRARKVLVGRLLQAGARAHLRRHPGAHGAGRGHRRRHGHGRAEALGCARRGRRSRPSSFRCRRTHRRWPTPATTPTSSRSTRCCASSSVWRATSRTSVTPCPRTSRPPSTRRSRWSSTSGSVAPSTPCDRCRCSSGRGWTASRSWASAARRSRVWRPATTSWTGSCWACSPRR